MKERIIETFNRLKELKGNKNIFSLVIKKLLDDIEAASVIEAKKEFTLEVY